MIYVQKDVSIPMRDGTMLASDVFRPARNRNLPVLLQRTPYGKSRLTSYQMLNPISAAEKGYAVVIQDCRGRYSSAGEFTPFLDEIQDGFDTIDWCATQPWSNGRVGMYGMSYSGMTQWLGAMSSHPALISVFPAMTACNVLDGWIRQGGALKLAFLAGWTAEFLAIPQLGRLGLDEDEMRSQEEYILDSVARLRKTLSYAPLSELPLFARQGLAPYFYEWITHQHRWSGLNVRSRVDGRQVASFGLGGWFDLFADGPPKAYQSLAEDNYSGHRLMLGPWVHNFLAGPVAGEANFGWRASIGHDALQDLELSWFGHTLRDEDTGIQAEPPVLVYVMGKGWQHYDSWPPDCTEEVRFFLHSGGRANSLNGDGTLDLNPPDSESPDVFTYDPAEPVPSLGAAGIVDQTPVERRPDVLVYTSEDLQQPIEVVGNVRLVLYASSSARDTDFTAKLVDVTPSGYARNICEGVIRARYRDTGHRSEFLTPDVAYRFEIELQATGLVFEPGHKIRLEISSSNFPKFDRNPNTGGVSGLASHLRKARQTIFHERTMCSYLLLPVVNRIHQE